jgi:hypothetical protein
LDVGGANRWPEAPIAFTPFSDVSKEIIMASRTSTALPTRARAASHAALRLYPGAVGELLARELSAWGEFGHRFGGHELVAHLITHLDERAAARERPTLQSRRRPRAATAATDVAALIARLRHPEMRSALYAGLYARSSAYPGPVGELVARELDGYVANDMCLAPSALLRRVLDQLLAHPGARRPQPGYGKLHHPSQVQQAA